MIVARYGPWTSLGQYVEEAQLQNYENQRAEFEAYIAHSHNAQAPSTGIVYWQTRAPMTRLSRGECVTLERLG